MVGSLLLRGMLVGVVAGLLAFGFARLFVDPEVDRAISFEQMTRAGPHAHGDAHTRGEAHTSTEAPEQELVSRATQSGLGLLTGIVVYGAPPCGAIRDLERHDPGRRGLRGCHRRRAVWPARGQ